MIKMKFSLFAVLLVVAGVYTLPQNEIETRGDRFIITNQIRSAIEKFKRDIREAGLDPVHTEEASFEYKPLPGLVEVEAFLEEFDFSGCSNIAINSLSHNVLLRRISFDLSLPEIRINIRKSGFDVKVFQINLNGRFNGGIKIKQTRLTGQVNYSIINIGITGISLNFSLDGIESDVRLIAFGDDHTERLTTFLGITIPQIIKEYQSDINKFLEDLIMELIKRQ